MASIAITDTGMVSTTGHTADLDQGCGPYDKGAWVVSWCPLRPFDRDQAITALTLAEFVTNGTVDATHKRWPFVRDFAAELDMDPTEAVRMIQGETL